MPFEALYTSDWRLSDKKLTSVVFVNVIDSRILNSNLHLIFKYLSNDDMPIIVISCEFFERILKSNESNVHFLLKVFIVESFKLFILHLFSANNSCFVSLLLLRIDSYLSFQFIQFLIYGLLTTRPGLIIDYVIHLFLVKIK